MVGEIGLPVQWPFGGQSQLLQGQEQEQEQVRC